MTALAGSCACVDSSILRSRSVPTSKWFEYGPASSPPQSPRNGCSDETIHAIAIVGASTRLTLRLPGWPRPWPAPPESTVISWLLLLIGKRLSASSTSDSRRLPRPTPEDHHSSPPSPA